MSDMTREEAKELFEDNFTAINTHGHYTKEEEGQAQEWAISALSAEEISEDGTLKVNVSDGSKVKRVLVWGYNIFGGLYYSGSAEPKVSAEGEYIKKEDLFNKTIKRNSIWNEITNAEGKGLEEIVNDLPTYSFPNSAENKGEWIEYKDDAIYMKCSKCNCWVEKTLIQDDKIRFCPWCGADMREPKGEKGTE